MPAPETLPGSVPAAARDLSDDEIDELARLLAALPEPFAPIGVVALDGFLCGVLVQPAPIGADEWLPYVCGADAPSRERIAALVLRRHAALNRALVEDGAFEPWLAADGEPDPDDENDPRRRVAAPSRPLLPWIAGFEAAILAFPDLLDIDDEAAMLALASIRRHLPADDDAQRRLNAMLDREWPLDSVDDAIDDLVGAVADLADLTRDARYAVETVRRDTPKVGRNDPCPCGSGRKYKRCHGAPR